MQICPDFWHQHFMHGADDAFTLHFLTWSSSQENSALLTAWLHFPLRNSSFPRFPILLDPISWFLVPAGKWGSMIQSIFLHFLLLRKHDSDLNNFECFWTFLEKKSSTWLIQLQSDQQIVQVLLNVLDQMRPPNLVVRKCHGVYEREDLQTK